MEYSHFHISPALTSSSFSPAACSPWFPSVPQAALRVVSLSQFPASMQGLSWYKIMQGQSKSLTIGEVVECFPEVLNTGVQWLKVLKPGWQK